MPPLTEEAFTTLVDAGCVDCHGKSSLVLEALVVQKLPLLGGEPYGSPSWGYKGEDLVRGTYRIACVACKKDLFTATACPRCDAPDGVERALGSENGLPLPRMCTQCGSEQLTALAWVPAFVTYEGKRSHLISARGLPAAPRPRAAKARTQTAPEDPGFHAFRVECKECRNVAERRNPCPLCADP